jgi:hypothetical protein
MPFEVQRQIDLPVNYPLQARLIELEQATIDYTDKKTGEAKQFTKLNWIFEVTEQGDYNAKKVRAETSAYLSDSPYNQFNNFAKALLGRELAVGQILGEGDLVGLPCLITVKYEEDRKDPSKKFARVADVFQLDPASADQPPF